MSRESAQTEIFVVDDEPSVLKALHVMLSHAGYSVRCFSDGRSFLAAARQHTPACVLLDVQLPGRSGLDILKELNAEDYPAPIFIVSGVGDIPMAVEAIRNGALDFIEKPFDLQGVVSRIEEAMEAWSRRRRQPRGEDDKLPAVEGMDQLTTREREVLLRIAAGASNKEAGRDLGISPRTVEVHRARIMEKLRARNAADLVRIVLGG